MSAMPSGYDALLAVLDDVHADLARTRVMSLSGAHLDRIRAACRGLSGPRAGEAAAQLELYSAHPDTARNVLDFAIGPDPGPRLLAAFFRSPSAKHLNFEYLLYEDLEVTGGLRQAFPSGARPISLRRTSGGLGRKRVVALFPEDWAVRGQHADEYSFYFICKFVERFYRYSLPALGSCIAVGTFARLRQEVRGAADRALVERLCIDWMWVHEHSHHQGPMPYREHEVAKGSREAGAFEEMRADVLGISRLLEAEPIGVDPAHQALLIEFILFERLVRYPIQCLLTSRKPDFGAVKLDYDSIGSQVLFRSLERYGCLDATGGRLALGDDWPKGLLDYLRKAEHCEQAALSMNPHTAREHLKSFVRERGGYDKARGHYDVTAFHCAGAYALSAEIVAEEEKG